MQIYNDIIKRLFDFIIALVLLIICFPFFLLVSILIKLESSGPIFFKQERLGKNGKKFTIYKFRTMYDKIRDVNAEVFGNNSEVTKVGKILRRFKIDELPQLINVVIGELSLVGPRPWVKKSLDAIGENKDKRLSVKPGLTGLAQVNGNIYISKEERLKFDLIYIEQLSFLIDFKIVLKTFFVLLFGEAKFKESKCTK